jgi:hypothetical protein
VAWTTSRGGRDGSRRGWKRLAPVVGVLLILAVPVMLQVGTLLALVCVAFACLGFALMRGRRAAISPAVANSTWTP